MNTFPTHELSPNICDAVGRLVDEIDAQYETQNGATALYWAICYLLITHIKEGRP